MSQRRHSALVDEYRVYDMTFLDHDSTSQKRPRGRTNAWRKRQSALREKSRLERLAAFKMVQCPVSLSMPMFSITHLPHPVADVDLSTCSTQPVCYRRHLSLCHGRGVGGTTSWRQVLHKQKQQKANFLVAHECKHECNAGALQSVGGLATTVLVWCLFCLQVVGDDLPEDLQFARVLTCLVSRRQARVLRKRRVKRRRCSRRHGVGVNRPSYRASCTGTKHVDVCDVDVVHDNGVAIPRC